MSQRSLHLIEHIAQKAQRGLAVMHVARTIADAEDLPGLGFVRRHRIVAGDLAVMRIEASKGPLRLQARRDHRPVHIQRQATKAGVPNRIGDQLIVDPQQAVDMLHPKSAKPAAQCSRRWQSCEPGEPQD